MRHLACREPPWRIIFTPPDPLNLPVSAGIRWRRGQTMYISFDAPSQLFVVMTFLSSRLPLCRYECSPKRTRNWQRSSSAPHSPVSDLVARRRSIVPYPHPPITVRFECKFELETRSVKRHPSFDGPDSGSLCSKGRRLALDPVYKNFVAARLLWSFRGLAQH
jgi:hypothetical protein